MIQARPQGPLVIGLTGPVGSGITTVSNALQSHGFARVSLSAGIKDSLRKSRGIPESTELSERVLPSFRKLLQDLGNEKRKIDPIHWLNVALASAPENVDLVIDGIRNLSEVWALRETFHRFFLIAVHASQDRRWSRVEQQYDGNRKQFLLDDDRDSGEGVAWGQQVTKCVDASDYVLNNDSALLGDARDQHTWRTLEPDLDLMRHIGGSQHQSRPPSPEEGHMAAAYAESHISRCLKRHVGAVVVASDGRVLSTGFNENPRGMLPCVSVYGTCYKDGKMHDSLSAMIGIKCPFCGTEIQQPASPWLCPSCQVSIKSQFFPDRNMRLCTAVHAEERAILSLDGRDASGGTMFSTTFPCFQCARKIVDSRISRVVYVEAYPIRESLDFFSLNNVLVEPFQGFKARAFNLVFRQVD